MSEFRVTTDSNYTGGLSWLRNFDAEIEPDGDVIDSEGNELYIVSFPEGIDGASLLDDCDCVIRYEEQ